MSFKFNGSAGAIICDECSVVIKEPAVEADKSAHGDFCKTCKIYPRCACEPGCTAKISLHDDVIAVYGFNGRVGAEPSWALASHVMAWVQQASDHSARLDALEARQVRPATSDESERRIIIAYLLDRAEQYSDDSGCKEALIRVSNAVARGDATAAANHGELDDLWKRAEKMSRK